MTWNPTEEGALARTLMRRRDAGVLSSMSTELPGYPFGSVTPYALTHDGRVCLFVSDIAQHTKNMADDGRVCLTVADDAGGDAQAAGRVSVVGDASVVAESDAEAVAARYFALFPHARGHQEAHGFRFWQIAPKRVRYIGGFGKIFWVEPDDWAVPMPEWADGEDGIIEHMNTDHRDALVAMANRFAGLEGDDVSLVAVDPEGCHVRVDGSVAYLGFAEPALTRDAVRSAMVDLAKRARA